LFWLALATKKRAKSNRDENLGRKSIKGNQNGVISQLKPSFFIHFRSGDKMNPEKLKQLQESVRIGGKGSARRKKKIVHRTATTDDKKLQSTLKKLSVMIVASLGLSILASLT
jgi:hypothetical protein